MPEDAARNEHRQSDHATDVAELRAAATEFARTLKAYGLDRLGALGDEVDEGSEALVREGRRIAHDLRQRLATLEARVERNIRDHPGTWIGGLLGAIGFGIVLGLVLRRKD